MITTQEALNRLLDNNEIFFDEMTYLMRQMMKGEMESEIIAAFLMGLRMKVETISEITAAVNVLKEFSLEVPIIDQSNLIDIVGTGGDGIKTFNISTTAMFVAAAMGAKIAKHGGKAVSSSSGSADIIETMGANIHLTPKQIAECVKKTNIGFMYAPKHNLAMRHVAPVRQLLGIRTIFNILGPLTNPANAKNQLLGVFHPDLLGIGSHVGKQLNLKHMMVVCGSDGMDEITISGATKVIELKNNEFLKYEIHPEDYHIKIYEDLSDIRAFSAKESLQKMDAVLNGEKGICRDIVLLNAGAALYCADIANDIAEGITMAKEAIDSKKAKAKKLEFIEFTNQITRLK